MTKLSFSDGNTLDVPFEVVQKNNSWKVLITPNSLKQNLESINYVAKPSSSSDTTSSATVSPNTAGQIATWSITNMLVDGGYWYSNATFSPNSDGYNECTLNLQQRSEFSGATAQIEYAIVVPHWYGDTVWGNPITVTGNIWGYSQKYYIYGDGTNPSGCKLRLLAYSGNRIDTFGEVYNY